MFFIHADADRDTDRYIDLDTDNMEIDTDRG